jgi:integrase
MQGSTPAARSVLRDAAIAPSTYRAYDLNLNKLLTHTRLSLIQLLSLSPAGIDVLLSEYLDHQHSIGGSYEYANQTLHGLVYRAPGLKPPLLAESRMRLRGWARLKRSSSHPPITWELSVVFAVAMATASAYAEAVGLLVSFDCYLRVGELTRITLVDVAMPNDPRNGSSDSSMAFRLAHTKTGPNQRVSMQNPLVMRILQQYLRTRTPAFLPADRIFPFSSQRLRSLMRTVAAALGVGAIPYVPHSLRHGGATHDYLRGASMPDIMKRGRWKSLESASRYIQQGGAMLLTYDVAQELHLAGQALVPELLTVMDHLRPPRQVHFAPRRQ